MKLAAAVPVRNEYDRYLFPFLDHLLAFCDEVCILNDDDDPIQMGDLIALYDDDPRISSKVRTGPTFFEHEGRFRNELLDWTLEGQPTHILAIDADEFVSDGQRLRALCEEGASQVWTLRMDEVWKADPESLYVRVDGKWGNRPVPMLYAVPDMPPRRFRIADRKIACGREPQMIAMQAIRGRATVSGVSCLHFGWTRESEREARYQRYVAHDLGKPGGHADAHLKSIMFPDHRVTLEPMPWPESLDREAILK